MIALAAPTPETDRYPWPREREGVPLETFEHFVDPHTAVKDIKCTHREIKDEWDGYDSLFYNEWLKVSIEPTRFLDWATTRRLGLETDLVEMVRELGLRTMGTQTYDLYPELVRQFMASVQVYYANDRVRRTNEGILTFLI